ncbi:hypothetical protein KAJ27_25035 [bacterium]|nr:hypothetical protein [bacterium]
MKKITMNNFIRYFLIVSLIIAFLTPCYAKKKPYSGVNKLLTKYNNYWTQAESSDVNKLHLFDAFTIEGKKFNFKRIMSKKIIIITFSDDFHLKLTSFWLARDCDYIPQHSSKLQFINILQPTQTYYTLYKRAYEKALKKHIRNMKAVYVKDLGRNMRKAFRNVKVSWIFDYRLEITRAYKMKKKRGILIYDLEGNLIQQFTGDEKNLKAEFNKALISILNKYGYYMYEKD